MAEMTLADKQFLAKVLFTKEKLDGKVIAKRVGVSENTISNWVTKFNWKSLRNRLLIGKDEILGSFYDQLEELNTTIKEKPKGKRYADTKEADVQIKLTASIRNLETDLAIADISTSGIKFIKCIQEKLSQEKVIEIADLWNDFLHEEIRKSNA